MHGRLVSQPAATAVRTRWQIQSMSKRRLIYYGTEDEMQLGDHILVRRWLRADVLATVTYIPGQSPPEPALTDYQFGYETEDGKHCCTDFDWLDGLYWSVVPKGIQLVCRSGEDVEAAIKSLETPDHL